MSNLNADQWSQKRINQLRQFEQACTDADLFCVGYLIPMVELVEVDYQQEVGVWREWNHWLEHFVESCLSADNISSDDSVRIREILHETNDEH